MFSIRPSTGSSFRVLAVGIVIAVAGLCLLSPFAFKWFESDTIRTILTLGCLTAGWRLVFLGVRAHASRIAHVEQLLQSRKEFVLYLRAFDVDGTGSDHGSVLIPSPTVEESLMIVLRQLGQVVAIGRPAEPLPPLGAQRIYLDTLNWKPMLATLFGRAIAVVIMVGASTGVVWELETAFLMLDPEKLILFIVDPADLRDPAVEQVMTRFVDIHSLSLITHECFISFDKRWECINAFPGDPRVRRFDGIPALWLRDLLASTLLRNKQRSRLSWPIHYLYSLCFITIVLIGGGYQLMFYAQHASELATPTGAYEQSHFRLGGLKSMQEEMDRAASKSMSKDYILDSIAKGCIFTEGSSRQEVLRIQGPPRKKSQNLLVFNCSSVQLHHDHVYSWTPYGLCFELKGAHNYILGVFETAEALQRLRSSFGLGSTRAEVIAAQGTPETILGKEGCRGIKNCSSALVFGGSTVYLNKSNIVIKWIVKERALKLRSKCSTVVSVDRLLP